MIKKARLVAAIGLVVALGASTVAFGDGASDNQQILESSISPTKLDKKKYKPIALKTNVINKLNVTGTQSNAVSEYISYPKNVKFDLGATSTCSTLPGNGSTPEQARAACPKDSYLGSGTAAVTPPVNGPPFQLTVSVFHGPSKNGVLLHTYSAGLGAAAPTVPGSIVKSNAGSKFGYALSVPNAPETGALAITQFGATISKASKSVLARCKSKTMTFQRKTVYKDGSTETTEITQKCKQKKSNKH